MRVLAVFGTRPEAIKMCPVILAFKDRLDVDCKVCLTGQHREMLRQVMDVFSITEDYNLDIMRDGQTVSSITADVLNGIGVIYEEVHPDLVLVHGDTTTSFAAALAAFYRHIPIGHVEAGLRTYDLQAPFPEEFNRCSIDMISSILFAPTERARQNLLSEKIDSDNIYITGNTVIDAMLYTVTDTFTNEDLKWAEDSRLILLTAHRRENWGAPMRSIFIAVRDLVRCFSNVKVIFPIHKNPTIRDVAHEIFDGEERIRLIEPLDVLAFHNYISHCHFILTDSGGIQEEAPTLGKPVLVLRDVTERPEGIEAGVLRLVGTEHDRIYAACKELLTDDEKYMKMSMATNPYGDGHASERIVDGILKWIGSIRSRNYGEGSLY